MQNRYEISWSLNENFINIVTESWSEKEDNNVILPFYYNYNIFKRNAIRRKKYVFGDINRKIEQVALYITNAYQNLGENYSDITHQNLLNFEKEHQRLLKQKEIYWKQRARIQLLKEGDNNTKFFHAYACNRRRSNMIHSLKIDDCWIKDLKDIKIAFVNRFKNLYTSNQNRTFSFSNLSCQLIDNSKSYHSYKSTYKSRNHRCS